MTTIASQILLMVKSNFVQVNGRPVSSAPPDEFGRWDFQATAKLSGYTKYIDVVELELLFGPKH